MKEEFQAVRQRPLRDDNRLPFGAMEHLIPDKSHVPDLVFHPALQSAYPHARVVRRCHERLTKLDRRVAVVWETVQLLVL